MAVSVDMRIRGLEDVFAQLRQYPEATAVEVLGSAQLAGARVLRRAVYAAAPPKEPGSEAYLAHARYVTKRFGKHRRYKRATRAKLVTGWVETFKGRRRLRRIAAVMEARVPHAHLVEQGHEAGPPGSRGGKADPYPVMVPAVRRSQSAIEAAILTAARKNLPALQRKLRAGKGRGRLKRADQIILR